MDLTLQVDELLEMLKVADIIGERGQGIETEEVIDMVERYYAPSTTLKFKSSTENF